MAFHKSPIHHYFILIILVIACAALWACGGRASNAGPEASGAASQASEKDIESVNTFLDTFQERYSARDIEGVSALFMDGGNIIIDFGGTIRRYTTTNWIDMTAKLFKHNTRITDKLTEREIKVYGDIAVATCRYDYDSPTEHSFGNDVFSLLRQGDKWIIVSLMYHGQEK